MDATIADHLAHTPLTTLALFSVTHTSKGAIDTSQKGYTSLMSDLGRQLVRDAHQRGTRVDVVYTSFGSAKNRKLFGDEALQAKVIASLVTLVGDLGADGVNIDIEGLPPLLVPAYGAFVGNLRAALVAANPASQVTVSTGAGALGAAMALDAVTAGADRVFLMGYDYHTGGSAPGATSPIDNPNGPSSPSLRHSLDFYAEIGVPVERTLLGLPLYGVEWPVAGPVIGAPETGGGGSWILRNHADLLGDASIVPERDGTEVVEVYMVAPDGSIGAPSAAPAMSAPVPSNPPASVPGQSGPAASPTSAARATATPSATPSASPGASGGTWHAIYVDSPATLERKLALANQRGLAGAGFWAIGYERGLPAYTDAMRRFVAGTTPP